MHERRVLQQPTGAEGYLQQLPSLVLLNRLPVAMLGIENGGELVYANPAFASMLGYFDAAAITRSELPLLLAGSEEMTPYECLVALRTTTGVVEWNHFEGYPIRTKSSKPVLLRSTDTLLLVSIADITAELWESGRH